MDWLNKDEETKAKEKAEWNKHRNAQLLEQMKGCNYVPVLSAETKVPKPRVSHDDYLPSLTAESDSE